MGENGIFSNVDNIRQAEEKYICLKHGLWRIEHDLSDESCKMAIDYIIKLSYWIVLVKI